MGSNIETLTVGSLVKVLVYQKLLCKELYIYIYIYQLVLYSRYPTWNYSSGAFKNR